MLKATENKVKGIKSKIKAIKEIIKRISFMQNILSKIIVLIEVNNSREIILCLIEILDKEFQTLKKQIK